MGLGKHLRFDPDRFGPGWQRRTADVASVGRDPRDGTWLARWRDPAGRQHKKSFRRKIDAQRWLDQLQAEMHRGQYIDPAGAKLRVGAFAESWAAGLGHLNRRRGSAIARS